MRGVKQVSFQLDFTKCLYACMITKLYAISTAIAVIHYSGDPGQGPESGIEQVECHCGLVSNCEDVPKVCDFVLRRLDNIFTIWRSRSNLHFNAN